MLITGLRKAVSANYKLGSATWSQSTVTSLGYVCSQPVTIRVPLVSSDLTTPTFADDTTLTAQATTATFDTSGETDGDGTLVVPNR